MVRISPQRILNIGGGLTDGASVLQGAGVTACVGAGYTILPRRKAASCGQNAPCNRFFVYNFKNNQDKAINDISDRVPPQKVTGAPLGMDRVLMRSPWLSTEKDMI